MGSIKILYFFSKYDPSHTEDLSYLEKTSSKFHAKLEAIDVDKDQVTPYHYHVKLTPSLIILQNDQIKRILPGSLYLDSSFFSST